MCGHLAENSRGLKPPAGAAWLPVTLWFLLVEKKRPASSFADERDQLNSGTPSLIPVAVYNHLESGHATTNSPTPISATQKSAWTNQKWHREYALMDANFKVLRHQLPEGTQVQVLMDDGTTIDTVTRSEPRQLGHGHWVVLLKGISGGYSLDRVRERKDNE